MKLFLILFTIAVAHAETIKRDTVFLQPIHQRFVKPAVVQRVIQPIIQDVVQPVVHQKTIQTIVNPVRTEDHIAASVNGPTRILRNKFVKREVVGETSNGTSTRFLGEWKLVSSDENFDALMKQLGVGFFTRKVSKT